jgi:fructose-1-phosphate kinase PfkB-like protein
MTLALSRGESLEDAVLLATAAGAATALTPVAKVCALADVTRLHQDVRRAHASGLAMRA